MNAPIRVSSNANGSSGLMLRKAAGGIEPREAPRATATSGHEDQERDDGQESREMPSAERRRQLRSLAAKPAAGKDSVSMAGKSRQLTTKLAISLERTPLSVGGSENSSRLKC